MVVTPKYVAFLQVLRDTQGLSRYERQITGSCCRPPTDENLVRGIRAFLLRCPEYKDALEHLLVG